MFLEYPPPADLDGRAYGSGISVSGQRTIRSHTDVLIDFLQSAEPAARRIGLELEHHALVTTVIARFEMLADAPYGRQRRIVGELLSALLCLPLDEAAADRAAAVRQTLGADGFDTGMGDSLVAGIVLAHRGILLTRSRRHFERVPELLLRSI